MSRDSQSALHDIPISTPSPIQKLCECACVYVWKRDTKREREQKRESKSDCVNLHVLCPLLRELHLLGPLHFLRLLFGNERTFRTAWRQIFSEKIGKDLSPAHYSVCLVQRLEKYDGTNCLPVPISTWWCNFVVCLIPLHQISTGLSQDMETTF